MPVSLALKQSVYSGNSQERLTNVLKKNKDRYVINKDGFISLNFDNGEVQAEIEKQVNKLSHINVSRDRK